MSGCLEGKVGLITGGAVGIGRATALAFGREGAKVVVGDILAEQGQETARLVQAQGGEALFVECDVTQDAQVKNLVTQAVATFGRLDCAFNNAGYEGEFAPTADYHEETWDEVIAVNLKGTWLCMKHEMAQMLTQEQGGAIVNTASVASVIAERGYVAYAAAKGGILQLTRTAAVEYGASHIRINAVSPGAVMTPMMDRALEKLSISAFAPSIRNTLVRRIADKVLSMRKVQDLMLNSMHPIGRPGQPNEIAEGVVWLCSGAASFVTGHNLVIDGGMTIA
ncbi:MAG: SDR family oxidoreductase [Anaerolineales bacterium]|nr:SDR family oxidoreductase [Anaerolineales bacterium]